MLPHVITLLKHNNITILCYHNVIKYHSIIVTQLHFYTTIMEHNLIMLLLHYNNLVMLHYITIM